MIMTIMYSKFTLEPSKKGLKDMNVNSLVEGSAG